ncbi:MAG: colanic acid biosynthesis acetyltransferase WcaF [Bacteroidota bacterium]|jgi:putative colanic acid biosynthesis acetyltransferase WcaF
MNLKTDLSRFDNTWYNPGPAWKRLVWYAVNAVVFNNGLFPFSTLKCFLLRLFGAHVGKRVVIKPSVNIKYPWKLSIGDNSWIGEGVWIDNLEDVSIGANACISQGALLLCGNHNYSKTTFDLMVSKITLEEGVWIGAKSVVTGGVHAHSHAVLAAGSVASSNLDAYTIYRGNPALGVRKREISL